PSGCRNQVGSLSALSRRIHLGCQAGRASHRVHPQGLGMQVYGALQNEMWGRSASKGEKIIGNRFPCWRCRRGTYFQRAALAVSSRDGPRSILRSFTAAATNDGSGLVVFAFVSGRESRRPVHRERKYIGTAVVTNRIEVVLSSWNFL